MTRHPCLIVMYHYVRDSGATEYPDIRALPPAMFEQQLDWLQGRYTVVGQAEVEAAARGEADLPERAALLTFDDGFVDHHRTVLPILSRRGLTGTFFVAADACAETPRLLEVHQTHFLLARLGAEDFGRAVLEACGMTRDTVGSGQGSGQDLFGVDCWDVVDERRIKRLLNYDLPFEQSAAVLDGLFRQHLGDPVAFARSLYLDARLIVAMAAEGMSFGFHTRSHRMLSRLSPDEQRAELRDGVHWIRTLTGQTEVSFCYPWGGAGTYTGDTVRLLDELNYSVGFNTVRRIAVAGSDGRFELPRLDTRDLPPYVTEGSATMLAESVVPRT